MTNVTSFGCFVDVGVHQDGLVHISEMGNDFITDPLDKVKPGEIVTVRVIAVDVDRKRVGFTMKTEDTPARNPDATSVKTQRPRREKTVDKSKSHNNSSDRKPTKPFTKSADTRTKTTLPKKAEKDEQKVGSLGALLAQAGLKKAQ